MSKIKPEEIQPLPVEIYHKLVGTFPLREYELYSQKDGLELMLVFEKQANTLDNKIGFVCDRRDIVELAKYLLSVAEGPTYEAQILESLNDIKGLLRDKG